MKTSESNIKFSPRILFVFLIMFCFGANVSVARNGIDPAFNAVDSSYITAGTIVTLQPDGKILLAGILNTNGVAKTVIVRLNADGSLDTSFNRNGNGVGGSNATISFIRLQANGKIIVAGDFSRFNGVPSNRLVRLNSDGTVDLSFQNTGFNEEGISNVEIQADGKILISDGNVTFVRLNADGSRDSTFNLVIAIRIERWTLLPDGKIALAYLGGNGIRFLRRYNSDGSLDTGYGWNNPAFALRAQPDGKLLISSITNAGFGVFRFNPDGTRDLTFVASNIGFTSKIELTLDNKILIIRSDNPNFVRLLSDGTVDTTFNAASPLAAIHNFAVQADGKIIVTGSAAPSPAAPRVVFRLNSDGSVDNSFNAILILNSANSPFDFDGDGRTDISVFRNGVWHLQRSQFGFSAVNWGVGSDKITPADFDGDGKTDLSVYRPSNGEWSVFNSATHTISIVNFGASEDLPRPADFDGDGRADICVFRPSNGVWYRLNSSNGQFAATAFGQQGDAPLVADFDADGKSDIAVFRPSNGVWYWLRSSDNQFQATAFGASGDKPVAADYDGDGKTDVSVFRPSNGVWYRLNSSNGSFFAVQFGQSDDVPTLGDYDGDGRADIAVFRPSNGVWYRLNSSSGNFYFELFGASGDRPIPSAFVP